MWTNIICFLMLAGLSLNAQSEYIKKIAAERQRSQSEIREPGSPIFVSGVYQFQEGRTTIGSAQGSTIRLPGRAPALVGAFQRSSQGLLFQPADAVVVTKDGKRIEGPTKLPLDNHIVNTFKSGDFSLEVRGLYLSVLDQQCPYAKSFHGLSWFPIDPSYRLEATYTPYVHKVAAVPDTQGDTRKMPVAGFVTFVLNGRELRLDVYAASPDYLFAMFKDQTSGHETYAAGRYLNIAAPKNGKAILDFNEVYNPDCAVSPFSRCPMVPKNSTLPVRVQAGETYITSHR